MNSIIDLEQIKDPVAKARAIELLKKLDQLQHQKEYLENKSRINKPIKMISVKNRKRSYR